MHLWFLSEALRSRPGQGVPRVPPPIQTWPGGTPGTPHHPDLARGYPNYPTPHHLDLAEGGYLGYPSKIQTWLGGIPGTLFPPSRPGWGTPDHPDLAGIPPTIQTWLGYPPLGQGVDWQTENSTFPILRMWAVIIRNSLLFSTVVLIALLFKWGEIFQWNLAIFHKRCETWGENWAFWLAERGGHMTMQWDLAEKEMILSFLPSKWHEVTRF